jgi:hypothetical protein
VLAWVRGGPDMTSLLLGEPCFLSGAVSQDLGVCLIWMWYRSYLVDLFWRETPRL